VDIVNARISLPESETGKKRSPESSGARGAYGPWVNYDADGIVNEQNTGTFKDGVKVT